MDLTKDEASVQIIILANEEDGYSQIAEPLSGLSKELILTHCQDTESLLSDIKDKSQTLILAEIETKKADILKFIKDNESILDNHSIVGLYHKTKLNVAEVMALGLNDFVELSNKEHLIQVVQRELRHLQCLQDIDATLNESTYDFTGLYSRRQFLELFSKELKIPSSTESKSHRALLYLQLDNFSWINESIGISEGDVFLKSTAKVINKLLNDDDIATRYQGGSFVILIHQESTKKLIARADMIREAIGKSIETHEESSLSSSCSVGIRYLEDNIEDPEFIVKNAFVASQTAQSNGGNSIHIYQDADERIAEDKANNAWDMRIREAFENDQFQLFFQPIVSLKGDKQPRYESLLRMIDNEGNIIAPGTFLPSAERAGLMADIDRRVIHYSINKALEEMNNGQEIEVFIKLSAKTLDDKKMPSWISNILKESEVPNENIVFEITESLALTHLAQTRRLVDSLKKMNCKVAIDHFGTRVKSFSLLNQIEVDYLKVDASLISNLHNNKSSQVIVKKIFRDALDKNIQVMAVSVQDANSLPIIWQYGFHFVQGYFLQSPDESMKYDFNNLIF